MEGRTRRRSEVTIGSDVEDSMRGFSVANISEEPVVWSNEELRVGTDDDRPPCRSDTGIHDHEMNRPSRKGLVRSEQRECARFDILWGDLVSDVRNNGKGIDRENRSLYRTNEIISRSE